MRDAADIAKLAEAPTHLDPLRSRHRSGSSLLLAAQARQLLQTRDVVEHRQREDSEAGKPWDACDRSLKRSSSVTSNKRTTDERRRDAGEHEDGCVREPE